MIRDIIIILYDPWFIAAFASLILWVITLSFPNLIFNVIRISLVLVFCSLTLLKWYSFVARLVLLLYHFHINHIVFLLYRRSDEWINGFLHGVACTVLFEFVVLMILYEATHWRQIRGYVRQRRN